MAIVAEKAKRVFKFDDQVLNDPNPGMTPDEVMDFYTITYPEIASAKLVGPDLDQEKGEINYEFKTEIKSKG